MTASPSLRPRGSPPCSRSPRPDRPGKMPEDPGAARFAAAALLGRGRVWDSDTSSTSPNKASIMGATPEQADMAWRAT